MGNRWNDGGYSSDVAGCLRVGERSFRIAQTGPNSFILRDPCELPPGTEGTIVISVDGDEREIHAFLQNGVAIGCSEVQYI
jgi:hypothetical protein